jgi:hypothetical protein
VNAIANRKSDDAESEQSDAREFPAASGFKSLVIGGNLVILGVRLTEMKFKSLPLERASSDEQQLPRCRPRPSRCDDDESHQPFPTSGPLFRNLDYTLERLRSVIGGVSGGSSKGVRAYKMTSVRLAGEQLLQYGSGPNFQGGRLTLCTCKHKLRAERPLEDWNGWWIAGFANCSGRTWLFYLSKIERGYTSASEIWNAMNPLEQKAKNARINRHGDLFEPLTDFPKDQFDSTSYHPPLIGHDHRQNTKAEGWRKDIEYYDKKCQRHSVYLSTSPPKTFIWRSPMLYVDEWPRHKKLTSVNHLLSLLSSD